jgi:uncharacterized protein (TIGR01244 family)
MSRSILLALCLVLGVSCSAIDRSHGEAADDAEAPEAQVDLASLEIINFRAPSDLLVTGGQLTQEQMVALNDQGYETFISLRPVEEEGAGWEEEFAAGEGISFVRIPVAGAAGVSRESAEQLAEVLNSTGSGAVVYCKSGNRVGALLALQAHFVDGESAEDALQFGLDSGMTRLEPLVRELLELPASDS